MKLNQASLSKTIQSIRLLIETLRHREIQTPFKWKLKIFRRQNNNQVEH